MFTDSNISYFIRERRQRYADIESFVILLKGLCTGIAAKHKTASVISWFRRNLGNKNVSMIQRKQGVYWAMHRGESKG